MNRLTDLLKSEPGEHDSGATFYSESEIRRVSDECYDLPKQGILAMVTKDLWVASTHACSTVKVRPGIYENYATLIGAILITADVSSTLIVS